MKNPLRGKILAVCISKKKGTSKENIGSCMLVENMGLEGDAHAGLQYRQVSLLSKESIDFMRGKGLDIDYGTFAENLTIEGLKLHSLPVGTLLRIGNNVLLRISQIGKECHTKCAIYQKVGDCVMPREGIFAEVVKGGIVSVNDEVVVEEDSKETGFIGDF